MKRFQSILCASLLAVVLASTVFAGNITTLRGGNITTRKDGNITTLKDGNITTLTLTDYIIVALASVLWFPQFNLRDIGQSGALYFPKIVQLGEKRLDQRSPFD